MYIHYLLSDDYIISPLETDKQKLYKTKTNTYYFLLLIILQ